MSGCVAMSTLRLGRISACGGNLVEPGSTQLATNIDRNSPQKRALFALSATLLTILDRFKPL